ncbi:NADH-Ubiquinone oxidoreductase B8 subunit [Pediculus humanus corporis]|uniref:NADH dehydrogenase [ubiquinone] 1 alpha subcomplex subunit 2 n=1 Tax=Pediculus humanus subsp. corporis TaxID=121224 RepID=E0VBZ5_PEDHC|nr:NADH-Ubiquinone oxidoreductase B8 subunit [Pediculus humanus corporis]EEB10901.1 NADH-Ubiquinone oxidoreductase B8 subunit [Pediculus humanus corporis]
MSAAIKFSNRLRELRIHLCQKNTTSDGVRNFINSHYLSLKQTNPKCPILIRECEGIQPKLWARFDNGEENMICLSNKNSDEILKQFESLVKGSVK